MLDPTIVLGIKPVQFEDPFSAQNVRNRIALEDQRSQVRERDAQTAINRAKLEREQQVNQSADRDLAEQKTQDEIIASNSNAGPDGTLQTNHQGVIQALIANGLGHRVPAYQKNVMIPAQQEAIKQQQDQLNTYQKHLDLTGSALGALAATPDEQLPAAHDAAVKDLEQAGVVKPGQLPTSQQFLQQAGGDQAKALDLMKQSHAQAQAATLKGTEQVTAQRANADFAQKVVEWKAKRADEAPKNLEDQLKGAGQLLGAADTPEKWDAAQKALIQGGISLSVVNQFGPFSPDAPAKAQQLGMSAKERSDVKERADTLAETQRHNKADEAAKNVENNLKAKQYADENGGDAIKGWVLTLKDNPDAVGSVPPKLRSEVQQAFLKQTGLPYPKALTGQTQTQEVAARNGLAALQQVSEDIKDPEIQKRLGPILGRLGNVEQDAGATVGLTPEVAAKAQRLRTNMRMMAMQEGRSVFGGRIPQQLMESFQSSSPNVKMEPGTLQGALQGMQDAGLRALDAADQERFGGKMRSREDRGVKPVEFGGGAIRYQDGGKVYNIPPDQEQAFLKDHPKATKANVR